MKMEQIWAETLKNACGANPGDRLDDRQSRALTLFVLRKMTVKPHRQGLPETSHRSFLPVVYVPKKKRGSKKRRGSQATETPETEAPAAKKPNTSEIEHPVEKGLEVRRVMPATASPMAKKPNTSEIEEKRVTPVTASPVAAKPNAYEINPNPLENGLKSKRVSLATKKFITFETNDLIEIGSKQRRPPPRRTEEAVVTASPVAKKPNTYEINPNPMENGIKSKRVPQASKKIITFLSDDPIEIGPKQRRPPPRRTEEAVVTVLPLPNKFREAMTAMGMIDENTIKFLVQKVLTGTDVGKTQNRLQVAVTKIKTPDFLKPEEERRVDSPEGMVVTVMEPSREVCELRLRLWRMNKNKYYALVNKNQRSDDSPHKWHGLVTRNGIRQDRSVQVWSFRVGSESKLCLALVKVKVGVDE